MPSRSSLDGSAAVVVGIASAEYSNWVMRQWPQAPSAYGATGGALSVACGRLSYTWSLSGPSLSVDTACSSSLVATHLALQAMRSCHAPASCASALVGGVGLLLNPEPTAMFQAAGMLALDGRCKTLDAAADGYLHGTGTPLGDPIEVVSTSAVKTHAGHTEAAAGVMGLAAVVTSLAGQRLPGLTHLTAL
ncbi:uncharacterized protein HaLaN_15340, partial [Haematococcus lacustris]